jgi:competence protein ComEC
LAVCFGCGVVLGRFVPSLLVYAIAAAVLAGAAFCIRFVLKKWGSGLLIASAVSLLLAACLTSGAMASPASETGEGLALTGHVYSEPYENDYGSVVCLLDDARVNGAPSGDIKLYVPVELNADLACGDLVSVMAEVEKPSGVRNPGGFDDRLYLLSQGIHYKAYAEAVVKTGYASSFAVAMADVRQYIGGVMDRVFEPDVAPIARGLLLGDKQGLDDNTYAAFKDTGMAHLLAVSGLHAGILIAAVYFFFRLIRLGRTPRLVATMFFIVSYACLTGLSPSIVRASVMAGALLLNRHFGRQPDTLSGLSLAFIVSLLLSPLDLFTAGFQLSFAAVFGMLTLGWQLRRRLTRWLPRRLSKLGDAVSASVGATAGTLPILAASFNQITIFSILLNIIMIPLASAAIALVFICTLLGVIFAPAASIIAYMPAVLIRFMMTVINWAANIPFMAISVASPPWYIVLMCFVLLFMVSKYVLATIRLKTALGVGLSAVALAALLLSRPGGLYLVFLDVGQGDAAYLRTAQGDDYFIDGGRQESADEVVDFAVRCGINPEAAFVSHTDDDHFSGLLALYNAGRLNQVFCSYQEEEKVAAAMPEAEVVPLAAGDVVLLDDETRAVVLYPYRDTFSEDANDMSLVLLVEYGEHSALFTGDIGGATETAALTGIGPVDIYKAAHHGSKYSSYRLPLSVLSPKFSVVSVGGNSYGQPHEWALKNLGDYSDEVYITRDDYAVEFYVDDDIRVNALGTGQK